MKTKLSSVEFYFYTCLAFLITAVILLFPADCLSFALKGLNLWFERMIPTLFPFMVLSGVIIRMDLTDAFVKMLNPILGGLFRIRPACVYGMLVGFLCGFPMGAHVAAQLYEQGQISKAEAAYLLSFCNNIGPVYFLSFVMSVLSLGKPAPFLFGMYGLPFLYGLLLRYTVFKEEIDACTGRKLPVRGQTSLLNAMDESVFSALSGIARLGGYMVFFNLLFILPVLAAGIFSLSERTAMLFTGGVSCLLEITGGIHLVGNSAPYLVLCILPFGGLSCIAQTYSMIHDTDLPLGEYVVHKLLLTALTALYYLAWRCFFPHLFLL